MEEKAKDIWSKVSSTVGGLSKTVKVLIVAGIVIALGAVAVVLAFNSSTEYEALFTDLTADDMTSITSYLNDQNISDYKIQDNDTILVPADKEAQLKASLIAAGYPQSGANYSLYLDKVSALSTESDRSQLVLFDLQDRRAAIIRCFDGVQDAIVQITPGEDRRYVLSQDDTVEATAAVVVTMKDDEPISQKLAEAIQDTVSHSVKGLVVDQVAIRDNQGNTYDGTKQEDATDIAKKKLELEQEQNKKIRDQVLDVLVPMFGEEHVSVSVNSTVEMNSSYEESTTYSQPDWAEENADGKGILGQKIFEAEIAPGENGIGGTVGAGPNADLPEYLENIQPDGTEDNLKVRSEETFENNKTVVQTQRLAGYLADVTIAVSIDGRVPNTTNPQSLVAHVARAAGLGPDVQDDKISIITHEFYSDQPNVPADTEPVVSSLFGDLPWWVYLALLAGLFLFMMLFTVFVLLGRRHTRRRLQPLEPVVVVGPEGDMEENLEPIADAEPAGADIMDVHTEKSMELRRSVRELAESNPEIAAQAIKSLLRGDEEGNG